MRVNKDPHYVVINDARQAPEVRKVLVKAAQPIQFPLSKADREILSILENKFDREENCAGLAAPQIGFPKQMIVFAALEDPALKNWRRDFTQYMPKTIWLNPSYEPIGEDLHEDYEGCFSVYDLAGNVKRYKHIKYTANLPDGTSVSGVAEGFLARIIQHEVDHLRGILFIDKVPEGQLFSISEYRKLRQQKMDNGE